MKPILTFLCSLLLLAVFASAEVKQPNVIVLLADDLGSKDLGCYGGSVKTPVLDGLAAKGVRFTDCHAGAAIGSPSRATLLPGRQHLRTGIYGVLQDHMHDMHLLEREVTIAEVLQEAGYGTAHFGKWHIGMTSGKRKTLHSRITVLTTGLACPMAQIPVTGIPPTLCATAKQWGR